MRVLFDPIYSSYPRKCSSAFKFKLAAEQLLDTFDDCFITWRIPDWSKDEDFEWLPKDDRICLHDAEHARTNRVEEYTVVRPDLLNQLGCYSPHGYAWDLVVTMRTGMAAGMRMRMNSARTRWRDKGLVIMEEMAVLTDRPHIGGIKQPAQDLATLGGYLASDVTLITADHVRTTAIQAAKRLFSPSTVMGIRDKLRLVSPIRLMDFKTKPTHPGGPLKMLYSGRMNLSTSNTEVSFKAMEAAFVMGGEEAPSLEISTVSDAVKAEVPSFATLKKNTREDFWHLLEHEADVAVYTTVDAEFSLTLIEPICFGVPVLCIRRPWSEALIGSDYPFFVDGSTEAYAFLKLFEESYDAMYAKFLAWRDTSFRPRFQKGGAYELNLVDAIVQQAQAQQSLVTDPGKLSLSFAEKLAEFVKPGEPFTMFDLCDRAFEAKAMENHLTRKKWHTSSIPAALKADLQNNRILIKHLTGAKDHGHEMGAMVV